MFGLLPHGGKQRQGKAHLAAAERKNKPLPIAICIGNEPMINLYAEMPLLYDEARSAPTIF